MADIKALYSKARDGDSSAQYELGLCYYKGDGTPKDIKQASEWWRMAAEQGNAEAQQKLGVLCYKGEGLSKDLEKAAEWFKKAAEQGLAQAQLYLGDYYYLGAGIPKDMKQASEWWRMAAEQGNAEAQQKLGVCYYKGDGVPRDLKQAAEWYLKASEQGNLEAQRTISSFDADVIAQAGIRLCKQLAEQRRSIEKLQTRPAEGHKKIEALTERLKECMTFSKAAKERLEELAKYEDLKKAMALDAELIKLRAQEKEYRAKINEHITSANLRAKKIIDEANIQAEQIAGDAVKVARDFRQYEQAIQAMRNIIEGYGNRYIVPGRSLLDELADIYGHTEAGKELKRAREHVKQMVINNLAAECDYVESSRSETAVTFVTDAFNGKVDSILSRVKRDNYGTLMQEIKDAFVIVNMNGRAFRNARITDQYLSARLDELKWASAAQEVKFQHQEEQRLIKEQMREEEKARREYERAIKETEKEEGFLKKAMETAQRQLAEATEMQKSQFEAQLMDLQQRLTAAEEKNKRALSMAQQTKYGYVYVISNIGSFGEGVYKIGMTRRLDPMDRVRELGDASVPFNFDVHAMIESDDAPALENTLHKHFVLNRVNKVNHRREFFKATVEEIKKETEAFGLKVQWTMAAEARHYYETLAIEKAIAENPEMRNAWINNQFTLAAEEMEEILSGKDIGEDEEGILVSDN